MPEPPLIHVYEADSALRALLAEVLKDEGYAVRTFEAADPMDVGDPRPALAIVELSPDPKVRAESGRMVAELRESASSPAVIGLTADYRFLHRATLAEEGAGRVTLLAKPFGIAQLLRVVAAMLAAESRPLEEDALVGTHLAPPYED